MTLLCAAAVIPFLFSPRVPHGLEDARCVTVNDWGPIHLTKNCDSEEFQYLARDPGLMLGERVTRQNRPLYPVLGWLVAAPLRVSGMESAGARILGRQDGVETGPAPGTYFPEYAAFVIINLALLVASLIILLRLLGVRSVTETAAVLPVTMLLVNEVTKAFFWTPHLQIFNVFVPLMSVYLYRWMQPRLPVLGYGAVAGIGIGLGIGSLAYGVFAVAAAGAVLCLLLGGHDAPFGGRISWRLLRSFVLLAAFFTPVFAWPAFVIATTGSFYSQEIEFFRQFIWMLDSFQSGGIKSLARDMVWGLTSFRRVFLPVVAFPLLVLMVIAAGRLAMRCESVVSSESTRHTRNGIIWFLIADVSFFALLGTYETRLAWSAIPGLIVLIGLEIERLLAVIPANAPAVIPAKAAIHLPVVLRAAVIAVSLCYASYWILRSGPYS